MIFFIIKILRNKLIINEQSTFELENDKYYNGDYKINIRIENKN